MLSINGTNAKHPKNNEKMKAVRFNPSSLYWKKCPNRIPIDIERNGAILAHKSTPFILGFFLILFMIPKRLPTMNMNKHREIAIK